MLSSYFGLCHLILLTFADDHEAPWSFVPTASCVMPSPVYLQVPEFNESSQPKPDFESYLNKVSCQIKSRGLPALMPYCVCCTHPCFKRAMAVSLLPPHTWDS